MTPSTIGRRTKSARPKPLICRTSMLSIKGNSLRDALLTHLIHTMLDEREGHDATTAETYSPSPGRQDLSLLARHCVRGVPGWLWAFSGHFAVSSFGDDH